MTSLRTSLLTSLKAIILALLLSVGISYLYAAWAPPTGVPPIDNTPAPINVGSMGQTKTSSITATDLIGQNSVASQLLQALGGTDPKVTSPKYCIGADCITAWPSSSGGLYQSVKTFTTAGAGTWTKPAGITKILVEVVGGGGGGARSCTWDGNNWPANCGGGGGGGGGYCKKLVDVSAINSIPFTVGAGGSAASGQAVSGGSGGTSTFGSPSLCQALGGAGGFGNTGLGGGGGLGSLGNLNLRGDPGGVGGKGSGGIGGSGGGSFFGGGGTRAGGAIAGVNGGGGAGGTGYYGSDPNNTGILTFADAGVVGTAGGSGMIVVWEF